MKNEGTIFSYREAILRIVFAIAVLLMAGGTSAGAVTNISACGTLISSPGEYVLNMSITSSGGTDCIDIYSNDVILDGAGYTINGLNASGYTGIYVYNSAAYLSPALTNVTVENITVTNYSRGTGIFYPAANGNLLNNNASNNGYGIYLYTSSNNNLTGNNASNNYNGILLYSSSSNNNLIGNNANSNNGDGIYLSSSSNNMLSGNNALNNYNGIFLDSSSNNMLIGNNANSNNINGIWLSSSSNNMLSSNNVSSNYYGINMWSSSSNNTLSGNNASNNIWGINLVSSSNTTLSSNNVSSNYYGIALGSSSNNTIYNNYFKNTNNFGVIGTSSTWNITKQPGINIIGGPYLGGNFWANPAGTGFSQTCADADKDGICDSTYTLDSNNIDYLPLSAPTSTPTPTPNPTPTSTPTPTPNPTPTPIATPNISSCGTISSPGEYVLNTDLSSSTNCINIISSHVIFDGSGHTITRQFALNITGIPNSTAMGVYVFNSTTMLTNVTIKNLTAANWATGIYYENTANGSITNNSASNNNYGIYLYSSSNNTLSSNNASNNSVGIVLESSSSNNLTGNNVSNNNYGINITSSTNNTIYNNYFNNTLNAADDSNNTWNITKQLGTNILGGPYLGGNFWSDYAGNDTDGDRIGDTLIPYNSSGNIVNGGDYLPLMLILGVTQSVSNGSTVTTNTTGTGTSASNPVVTSVTTPNAGTVSIQEMPATQNSSTGFYFLGQQVNITAPPANTSSPLVIIFTINSSQIPAGQNQTTIQILKDGVVVNPCNSTSPTISPDPCVSNRATLSNGDVEITVLTSTASKWLIGVSLIQQIPTNIQGLITSVQSLVASGVLNHGQGDSLIAKLNAAMENLNKGNTNAAINQLQAFINEVQADIRAGILTVLQGQSFIEAGNAVISQISR